MVAFGPQGFEYRENTGWHPRIKNDVKLLHSPEAPAFPHARFVLQEIDMAWSLLEREDTDREAMQEKIAQLDAEEELNRIADASKSSIHNLVGDNLEEDDSEPIEEKRWEQKVRRERRRRINLQKKSSGRE